jgi:hypothetical protein
MRNNRDARATIIIVPVAITAVVTSLFVDTMTIVPQQADALSIYDPDASNPGTLEKKFINHWNKMITPQQYQQ